MRGGPAAACRAAGCQSTEKPLRSAAMSSPASIRGFWAGRRYGDSKINSRAAMQWVYDRSWPKATSQAAPIAAAANMGQANAILLVGQVAGVCVSQCLVNLRLTGEDPCR